MARVKFMNFTTGQLGDVGFRQQTVRKEDGSLGRATIAYQIQRTNSSNSPLQSAQRSRFRFAQVLGSALTAKAIINNFFRNSDGLRGFQAFISRNLRNGAIINKGGTPYVDWRKLIVSTGKDQEKIVRPYLSTVPQVQQEGDDCSCFVKLAWSYDWTCDVPNPDDYALYLVGIKIDPTGALEDVVCVQPRVPMSACMTDVALPDCDCCKTYWYAFFVDPINGRWTQSNYIGTCDQSCLEEYDESCAICNQRPVLEEEIFMMDECPVHCGTSGDLQVDKSKIIFNGDNNISLGDNPDRPIPIFTACPNYLAKVDVTTEYTGEFTFSFNEEANASSYNEFYFLLADGTKVEIDRSVLNLQGEVNGGTVTIPGVDNSDNLKAAIEAVLGGTATVTLNDIEIQEYTISYTGEYNIASFNLANDDSSLDTSIAITTTTASYLDILVNPADLLHRVVITGDASGELYKGNETSIRVDAPTALDATLTVEIISTDEQCHRTLTFVSNKDAEGNDIYEGN